MDKLNLWLSRSRSTGRGFGAFLIDASCLIGQMLLNPNTNNIFWRNSYRLLVLFPFDILDSDLVTLGRKGVSMRLFPNFGRLNRGR